MTLFVVWEKKLIYMTPGLLYEKHLEEVNEIIFYAKCPKL
jgi:hypothetical protein